MDEKVAEYKKALQEHERVIVYCDADEFPNVNFRTNSSIMFECEKLLGDDYKVIYVWGHMADNKAMCHEIYGVVDNMSPYIVLYKNGIEIIRSDKTYTPNKLADWIREQLK
jgi:hypothetical protein